ncbi:hypothetical protein [Streptomyces sp. URMC 129]|uniref:hypothetical protein n=1 Tax=Streptomyces sp. URMC 129 TaxID=3423407 RepID=UPI003F1DC46D
MRAPRAPEAARRRRRAADAGTAAAPASATGTAHGTAHGSEGGNGTGTVTGAESTGPARDGFLAAARAPLPVEEGCRRGTAVRGTGDIPGAPLLAGALRPARARPARDAEFLTGPDAGTATYPDVTYTVIATATDRVVIPYTSSFPDPAHAQRPRR